MSKLHQTVCLEFVGYEIGSPLLVLRQSSLKKRWRCLGLVIVRQVDQV